MGKEPHRDRKKVKNIVTTETSQWRTFTMLLELSDQSPSLRTFQALSGRFSAQPSLSVALSMGKTHMISLCRFRTETLSAQTSKECVQRRPTKMDCLSLILPKNGFWFEINACFY